MSKKTVSWEQIADILIEDFTKKDYKKDEKMMSENEMAIRFGVPRAEIRRAYERTGLHLLHTGMRKFFLREKRKNPSRSDGFFEFFRKNEKIKRKLQECQSGCGETEGNFSGLRPAERKAGRAGVQNHEAPSGRSESCRHSYELCFTGEFSANCERRFLRHLSI